MMPTIPMLLIFADEVLFPPSGASFIVTESGNFIVKEDGETRMITE